MSPQPPVEAITNFLEDSQRILVVSHIDPDGDALGTQLAFGAFLTFLGKDVFLVRDSKVPDKYRFLRGADDIPHVDTLPEYLDIDAAVALECPDLDRIGKVRRHLKDSLKVLNIDHHRDNDLFGDVNWVNAEASSVAEMIYEYFVTCRYPIDADVAEQLYTAIMTDTGRFRYNSTSPRTMTIAGELIAAGANPQKICDEVYFNLQSSTMKLIGRVLNSIEFLHRGQICLLTLTREMLEHSGADDSESDGLVDYTLYNVGVRTGALLKQIAEDKTKISLRSKDGINVSAIAARYGGGGHFNAAGCIIPKPLPEAKEELVKVLIEALDASHH